MEKYSLPVLAIEKLIEQHKDALKQCVITEDSTMIINPDMVSKNCTNISKKMAIDYANWYFGQFILRNSKLNGLTDEQIFLEYLKTL